MPSPRSNDQPTSSNNQQRPGTSRVVITSSGPPPVSSAFSSSPSLPVPVPVLENFLPNLTFTSAPEETYNPQSSSRVPTPAFQEPQQELLQQILLANQQANQQETALLNSIRAVQAMQNNLMQRINALLIQYIPHLQHLPRLANQQSLISSASFNRERSMAEQCRAALAVGIPPEQFKAFLVAYGENVQQEWNQCIGRIFSASGSGTGVGAACGKGHMQMNDCEGGDSCSGAGSSHAGVGLMRSRECSVPLPVPVEQNGASVASIGVQSVPAAGRMAGKRAASAARAKETKKARRGERNDGEKGERV